MKQNNESGWMSTCINMLPNLTHVDIYPDSLFCFVSRNVTLVTSVFYNDRLVRPILIYLLYYFKSVVVTSILFVCRIFHKNRTRLDWKRYFCAYQISIVWNYLKNETICLEILARFKVNLASEDLSTMLVCF